MRELIPYKRKLHQTVLTDTSGIRDHASTKLKKIIDKP